MSDRVQRIVLAVVFAAYCGVVAAGAIVHEPWWDEAQAWLIARDASPVELFTHIVRYEGHPPLWYLILAIPAKLGLPYWTMKVVAALAGCATVLLLLYGFPRVPLVIRAIAPFAFFLAYQYTVVARSYVLFGPLLLGIAYVWDRRHERFGTFVTLLILLSHVSVHGFAIACALFAVSLRRHPQPATRNPLIAFALNTIVLIALLWPPGDITSQTELHDVLSPKRHFFVLSSLVPAMFWNPSTDESLAEAVVLGGLALLAVTVLVFWFARNGVALPFLLATAGALVIAARYYRQWHEGIFFFLLLFAIVLAFQRGSGPRWLNVAAQVIVVLLLARHAQWTFRSIAYDAQSDFTGSARAAELLAAHRLHERVVYGTGIGTVELQPYFDANLFRNARTTYWDWSPRNDWPRQARADWLQRIVAARPDVIVTGISAGDDHRYAQALMRDGRYRAIGAFAGHPFWKTRPSRGIAYMVFRRSAP